MNDVVRFGAIVVALMLTIGLARAEGEHFTVWQSVMLILLIAVNYDVFRQRKP